MRRLWISLVLCFACSIDAPSDAQPRSAPAATPAPPTPPVASSTPPTLEPAPSSTPADDAHGWPIERPSPQRVAKTDDAVTLDDPGAQPHLPLRLAPVVGKTRALTLRMNLQVAMKLGPQDIAPATLPNLRVTMDMTPKDTSAEGVTTYAFAVTKSEREELEGASARLLAAMDKAVEGMRESKGTVKIDDRGRTVAVDYGLPELASPSLRPSLAGFQQSFSQLFPVLPQEPVGVGASWTATVHFDLSGVPVAQRSTYRLTAREGDRLELAVSFEQSATGDIDAPAGVALEGTRFGGKGEGTVSLGLDSPFPIAGSAQSRTLTESSVSMGGSPAAVEMDLLSTLSIDADQP